jgi:CBS domain containing-hemolysin-like protein
MADSPTADPKQSFRAKLARLIAGAPTVELGPVDSSIPDASPGALRLRIAEFETLSVRDVMASRTEISAVEVHTTMGDVLKIFAQESHSRMPVYRDELDEPIGFIHIKDVVAEIARLGWSPETLALRPLDRLKRNILLVAESMRLPDLLVEMQKTRTHIALVVDEYGGIDGVVALEDLVEQIVGDIEDEHDEAPPPIIRRGKTTWEVDALAQISDVERATHLQLAVQEHEADIETVGGLATALAGRVPEVCAIVEHPAGHRFEILEADERRVVRLKIKAARPAAPADASAPTKLAAAADAGQNAPSAPVGAAGETS